MPGIFYENIQKNFEKKVDKVPLLWYNIDSQGSNPKTNTRQVQKGENMNEDMNVGEMLRELAEENQTRKILEILEACKTIEEAKEKVRALLNK